MESKRNNRKRYGVLVVLTLANWLAIAYILFKVDPESMKNIFFPNSYFPMTLLITSGFFWLFSILLLSSKRAVFWAVGFGLFIQLRFLGLGSWVNALLIIGVLLSKEISEYYSRPRKAFETEEKLGV